MYVECDGWLWVAERTTAGVTVDLESSSEPECQQSLPFCHCATSELPSGDEPAQPFASQAVVEHSGACARADVLVLSAVSISKGRADLYLAGGGD